MSASDPRPAAEPGVRAPRLAFVGTGWIGRDRMRAVLEAGTARVGSIVDPSDASAGAARRLAPGAPRERSLEDALASRPDGVVIATPSSLHARQALTALEAGVPVFCQKPLARTAAATRRVVREARRRDLPLGVDFAYRRTAAMRRARSVLEAGEIGRVYAARFVFHNAYGPDAGWFYDPELSGGGCVIDLGTHLIDLALWLLGSPAVEGVSSRLHAGGRPLGDRPPDRTERPRDGTAGGADGESAAGDGREPRGAPDASPYPADDLRRRGRVEDFATATLDLDGGAAVRLACSWNLHAGRDAVVEADLRGTEGSLSWRNVDGSFYDFTLERLRGGRTRRLCSPPDDWPGRALVAWTRRVADGSGFDDAGALRVARVVDRIYRDPAAPRGVGAR